VIIDGQLAPFSLQLGMSRSPKFEISGKLRFKNDFHFRGVARAGWKSLRDMRDKIDSPDFQYGCTADGMPVYDGGHISSGRGYVSSDGGYVSSDGGYVSSGRGYVSSGQGYASSGQKYVSSGQEYVSSD
jgi:hypothetical protein